jgi:hypothetical protein
MGDVEMGKEEEEPEKPQEIEVIANKGTEVVEAEALAQENARKKKRRRKICTTRTRRSPLLAPGQGGQEGARK